MSGQPAQRPIRSKGFFERAMLDWRTDSLRRELTPEETVTCAAQFLGLAIAALDITVESQILVMESAAKITNTACLSRTAVKQGLAWPIQSMNGRSRDV